jgi:hypothetical protein
MGERGGQELLRKHQALLLIREETAPQGMPHAAGAVDGSYVGHRDDREWRQQGFRRGDVTFVYWGSWELPWRCLEVLGDAERGAGDAVVGDKIELQLHCIRTPR